MARCRSFAKLCQLHEWQLHPNTGEIMKTRLAGEHGALFVLLTIVWTWGILSVPIFMGYDIGHPLSGAALALAGASPSVFGLIFARLSGDATSFCSFVKRIFLPSGTTLVSWLAVFALIPAVTILSAYASALFGMTAAPDWSVMTDRFASPVRLIAFAGFTLVFGPLAEEIGWRGYLLDCWKDRGILVYGVGIGFVWTIWHLPMFFIGGTYQNTQLNAGWWLVLCFTVETIALGAVVGELTRKTGSILTAILFHFSVNFTGELMPLTPGAEVLKTIVLLGIAVCVVFVSIGKGKRHESARV